MKVPIGAFNQEKALPSRGLLRDYEPSDGPFSKHCAYTDDGIFYLRLFAQIKKINSGYFLNKITMLVLTATIS